MPHHPWERRHAKRAAAVAAVKHGGLYADTPAGSRPPTPDPAVRSSKRTWERAMMEWRAGLRALARVAAEVTDEGVNYPMSNELE